VTPDEANDAVVAFLDQFIERGASPDVRDLRERLGSDPKTRQLLYQHFPIHDVSDREAFDGMRAFFAAERERGERTSFALGMGPDLVLLESWTSWEPDGVTTSDPAQWHDWLAAVERATHE
jgi:hypothetical protein